MWQDQLSGTTVSTKSSLEALGGPFAPAFDERLSTICEEMSQIEGCGGAGTPSDRQNMLLTLRTQSDYSMLQAIGGGAGNRETTAVLRKYINSQSNGH